MNYLIFFQVRPTRSPAQEHPLFCLTLKVVSAVILVATVPLIPSTLEQRRCSLKRLQLWGRSVRLWALTHMARSPLLMPCNSPTYSEQRVLAERAFGFASKGSSKLLWISDPVALPLMLMLMLMPLKAMTPLQSLYDQLKWKI